MYDILFHTAVNIFKYLYLVYYYYSMYIVYLYLLLHTIYYIIPIQYLVQFIGRVGESNICTNIVYRIESGMSGESDYSINVAQVISKSIESNTCVDIL